jgi:hypothetical protein
MPFQGADIRGHAVLGRSSSWNGRVNPTVLMKTPAWSPSWSNSGSSTVPATTFFSLRRLGLIQFCRTFQIWGKFSVATNIKVCSVLCGRPCAHAQKYCRKKHLDGESCNADFVAWHHQFVYACSKHKRYFHTGACDRHGEGGGRGGDGGVVVRCETQGTHVLEGMRIRKWKRSTRERGRGMLSGRTEIVGFLAHVTEHKSVRLLRYNVHPARYTLFLTRYTVPLTRYTLHPARCTLLLPRYTDLGKYALICFRRGGMACLTP